MFRYETLMLIRPDASGDELSSVEKQISDVVTGSGAKVLSFDKWGKYKLSYPVKKHEYGIYILARYEMPKDKASKALNDLQTIFRIKVNDIVLRQVCRKLDTNSLEYTKPEPIETRSVTSTSPRRDERSTASFGERKAPVVEKREEVAETVETSAEEA